MRIFLSAGEPSGDLHGGNLVRALHQINPTLECTGFGGERLEAAGARLVYPLCRLAIMGFARVLPSVAAHVRLLRLAGRHFDAHRPDAVVLIDYPGFHWWLARVARRRGIPVYWFVPPQLWAWAGWRVRKMRRLAHHVLCSLPFEEPWYRQRGVPATFLGHPYFDELTAQRLDAGLLAQQQGRPGNLIGLLPGSRNHEVADNLETLLGAAARIHAARPDTRFLMACLRPEQRDRVLAQLPQSPASGLPVEVLAGRTPEVIHLAHLCIAVSGSVGLELLHHGKPSVVVYRTSRVNMLLKRVLLTVPYISLVNLLAGRELFPELLSARCQAAEAAEHALHWLNDPTAYEAVCRELAALRARVGEPGACARAAAFLTNAVGRAEHGQAA